jgi:UDP-3-O-[3-hydroxymyristoyl] N-acetylglucosamine deacetylase
MLSQATIAAPVEASGIGLHRGEPARVTLQPAPPDHGVVFYRVDLPGNPAVPARFENVVDTTLATTLGTAETSVATVEHLIAALTASRLDNVRVEVHGPELPILDGSARTWMALLDRAGRADQRLPARRLVIREPVEVRDGERWARLSPSDILEVAVTIDFPHPLIGRQSLEMPLTNGEFGRELAWARTFGFLAQVEAMHSAGLARGGSLENAVVYGEAEVLNPEGLRAPDEPVRHKLLDLIGDLGLLGARLQGRVETSRPGHAITLSLLQALLDRPDAYSWE